MRAKVIRFNYLVFQSVFMLVAFFVFAFSARAEERHPMDPQLAGIVQGEVGSSATAREVVSRQLAAIERRDAGGALALTTASFHEKHPDAAKFLSSIRLSYRPIYNHQDYTFLDNHAAEDGSVMQKVEMEDRYTGESSTVIYRLEQQADGVWLIDSFAIIEEDEAQPI